MTEGERERERELAARGMFWVVWMGIALAVGFATRSGLLGAAVGLVAALGVVAAIAARR